MPLSLKSILSGASADEVKQQLVSLLLSAGFPATSWQPFTVGRTLVEGEALSLSDLAGAIAKIGASGFLAYAEGAWLDLVATELYASPRKAGVTTQGTVEFSDAAGAGPFTLPAGVWIANPAGGRYQTTTSAVLPLSGTVSVVVQAERPGAAYNVADGTDFTLVTSLPGVTATTDTPPGSTWITQQGADRESDADMRIRCRDRWPTLGYGATIGMYRYWALTASNEVTKVAAFAHTPAPGQVSVYLAGPSGPVSPGAVAAVQAYLDARAPLCVQAIAAAATQLTIVVQGSVGVKAERYNEASAAIQQRLAEYFATIPIGGSGAGFVFTSEIIRCIMDADPGVVYAQPTNPSHLGVALLPDQIAVLSLTVSPTPYAGALWLEKV